MKIIIDKHRAGQKINYMHAELDNKKHEVHMKLDYYDESFEGILKLKK